MYALHVVLMALMVLVVLLVAGGAGGSAGSAQVRLVIPVDLDGSVMQRPKSSVWVGW